MKKRIAGFAMRVRGWLAGPADAVGFVRRHRAGLRGAEVFLWVVALAAVGYCSVAYAGAAMHQRREKAALASGTFAAPSSDSGAKLVTSVASPHDAADYGVLGVVEIPRLNISSVVEEGVDSSTLWEAVGHIPGTAMPGQNGNAALAAHRDTYFRGLGDVVVGDEIVFRTATERFRYRVESTEIVDASATDALPDSAGPTLSLVTCYPFHYVGPAPKRFIVVARAE